MKLTEISTVKALCNQFGFSFKKKFGQNFIVSAAVPEDIAAVANGGCALEIGPGIGTLTRELCNVCEKVVALEIDTTLAPLLETTVGDCKNLKVFFQDAMKTDIKKLCDEEFAGKKVFVCANLPYYITTPVLMHLLESGVQFEAITVMVQKEVADRLCSKAGTSEYGAITLTCQMYGKVVKLFDVPKHCFYPVPGVDSSVISIIPAEKEKIECKDEKMLKRVIRATFNQRRKTLVNALSAEINHISKEELAAIIVKCGHREDIRGEKLTLAQFAQIVNNM
jgi:16S rRNA (adenine1518-N6/adenine1519-N6)-dimethyltransferase